MAAIGDQPVFGFILFGGSTSGALVRDTRLANALADRGYAVHVWWVMDRPKRSPLRDSISEYTLFGGLRHLLPRGRWLGTVAGKALRAITSDRNRAHSIQRRPALINTMMARVMHLIVAGVENDKPVLDGFVKQLREAGVTHVLPMLAMLAPWAHRARQELGGRLKYCVTFQGYELYVHYARRVGLEDELYRVMRRVAAEADYPSLAVSRDYLQRVIDDIGVPGESLTALPPGVPTRSTEDLPTRDELAKRIPRYEPGRPVVTYLGRRDPEKGIDLLLYAARILRQRGREFQLFIGGPTLWGDQYGELIKQIAVDLRLEVTWRRYVSDELREALFGASRCVVYPSIHREPFGMVPVEAGAYGTPAVVPDYGGVAETVQVDDMQCGLRFRVWDSGDLADKIDAMLTDEPAWRRMSADGPRIAEYYSIERLADRVLDHLGVGR